MKFSRKAAWNESEKKLHNFAVLRYIIRQKPTAETVMDAFQIKSTKEYNAVNRAAVDRLLFFMFGYDGIGWKR